MRPRVVLFDRWVIDHPTPVWWRATRKNTRTHTRRRRDITHNFHSLAEAFAWVLRDTGLDATTRKGSTRDACLALDLARTLETAARTSAKKRPDYNTKFTRKLARWVKGNRQWYGWTQRDLARLAGINQSTVARMEGAKCIPKIDTMARVIVALKIGVRS